MEYHTYKPRVWRERQGETEREKGGKRNIETITLGEKIREGSFLKEYN